MKKNYSLLIIFLLSIFSIQNSFSQIYNADFSNDGDGFADHTSSSLPATAPASVGPFGTAPNQWSLSYTTTPSSDGTANSFKVSGGALVSNDWGGQGIFTSQSIDISTISTINISALGSNIGANDDNFTYFYILDGGTRVDTTIGATNNGDPVNYSINNLDVSGNNSIQVGFEFSENGSGDGYSISSFSVSNASNQAINFNNSTSSINETDATVNTLIPVTLSNYSTNVTVSVTVDGSSTAQVGDYTLNTNSLAFTANGSQNISLDINDDVDFISETVILNIAVTSGTADITTSQHTVTINDDDLPIVINEINADPDSTNGDANGDGTSNFSEDEFVEIYNISGANLDISGWVLADAASDRHTFPNGTIVPANESIVVFGGGTPVTVPGLVQVASTNSLGLSNSGDTVVIKNGSGDIIISESYGSEGGNNQSLARNDDLTGTFVQHSTIVSNAVLFSPGKDNTDNTPFSSSIKWTGATSNDWSTGTNWLGGVVPSNSSDVVIPAGLTNYPTASSFIFVNSITFESGTSLLFNSFVNGQITYNRDVTSNWHLVASPINGESIDNLITNNSFSTGTSTNIGIGLYDNDNATTPWQYQNSSSTGALASGTGISVKLNTSSIVFKGNMYTGSDVIPVTTGSRTDFNLIGNRYTAYLDSDAFLTNISNTPALAEQTIWLWDGTQYVTKNLTESIKIAPTQGFFIKAAIDTNVALNPAMLSHNSTDTFLRQAPKSSFELSINNGEVAGSTKVYYIDGKTKGFDNGYDSRIFEGADQNFAVYTQLLNDNDGRNLAIQTLPNNNLETMVIPVGLITDADQEITFSAITTNLPSGVDVYLEDRVNNTFVNLSEGNYTFKTKSVSNGVGQYYIHTTSAKLSNDDISKDIKNVSIYGSANNEITVTGLQAEANVKVFSLLGEELINSDINSNGVSKISLPSLSTGVYVVKLNSTLGNITKKVILE
ncbi:lamin tail domain-containing protein [uncultured Tenacibaculum sp.]|uniref:lamin tail domain-containing protein n=1 Tax=uncultured Tenacibaculum sp. TaxID=174713 RepID=UPI0026337E35|nr:lamin tail domain-containing protein [uncultured Tenacibaculum sp.]